MFNLLEHRKSIFWTSLIIFLVCVIGYISGVFYNVDKDATRIFLKIKQVTDTSEMSDIVIVHIDKKSLKQDYLWQWGDQWYPYFINLLVSYNPKAVLLLVPEYVNGKYEDKTGLLDNVDLSKVVLMELNSDKELAFRVNGFYEIPIIEEKKGEKQYSLAPLLKLIYAYYDYDKTENQLHVRDASVHIKNEGISFLTIPVHRNNLIVNLTSKNKFEHYNYFDILVKAQKMEGVNDIDLMNFFDEKIVIFSDNNKKYSTALGKLTKAELLANAIYAIVNKKFVRKGHLFGIPFIFFTGILLFILLTKFNFTGRTLTWFSSLILTLIVCYYLFIFFGILVTVTTPLLLITLLYININIYGFSQHRNTKLKQRKNNLAREIKKRMIPRTVTKMPGVDLQVGMIESSEVGGDFYDLIKINNRRMVIVMGTVSERGLNGAQQIEKIVTKIKLVYNENIKLNSLCNKLNEDWIIKGKEGHFVKLLIMDIDFTEGIIRLVNSGQVPPFVIYPRSSHIRRIKSAEPVPLGIYRNRRFNEQVFRLNVGDVLVVFSEGLYENSQTIVDYEKVFSNRNKKVSYFVDKIMSESRKRENKRIKSKDQTLIIMKRL